jgi:hypothetical protein
MGSLVCGHFHPRSGSMCVVLTTISGGTARQRFSRARQVRRGTLLCVQACAHKKEKRISKNVSLVRDEMLDVAMPLTARSRRQHRPRLSWPA